SDEERVRPAAPACERAKSIERSPRKTWGVVLGNGPITRHWEIGSNRARTRSIESAAAPENSEERAAAAIRLLAESRTASRADSANRRRRGAPLRSASRYKSTALRLGRRKRAAMHRE